MAAALPDALRRHADGLLANGYAVIDDALSDADADGLHAGMEALRRGGGLRQHKFGFRPSAAAPAQIFTKPSIFEAEADDEAVRAIAPELLECLQRLGLPSAAKAAFPSLRLLGDGSATIKLQCNEGSHGCFPLHYDNAGPPSRRQLTALFYLNPGWAAADGGELQLQPWLRAPVRVPPMHGRLVLFLSDTMLHRVLPCHARRYCFTIWLDGEATNGAGALQLDSRLDPASLHLHPSQRILSRAVRREIQGRATHHKHRGGTPADRCAWNLTPPSLYGRCTPRRTRPPCATASWGRRRSSRRCSPRMPSM